MKKLLIALLLLALAWLVLTSGMLRSTIPGPGDTAPADAPPDAAAARPPSLADQLDRAGRRALGQRDERNGS